MVRDHAVDGADLHHEVRVEFGDVDLGTVSDEQLGRRSSDSRSATGDDGGATSEEPGGRWRARGLSHPVGTLVACSVVSRSLDR